MRVVVNNADATTSTACSSTATRRSERPDHGRRGVAPVSLRRARLQDSAEVACLLCGLLRIWRCSVWTIAPDPGRHQDSLRKELRWTLRPRLASKATSFFPPTYRRCRAKMWWQHLEIQ